jgi:hypothetical protein
VRETNDLQTTITLGPVNCAEQMLSLGLELQMTLPMPHQDEHLPDQIEAFVHQAGLALQRRLFRALIEKADQELILEQRQGKGGAGIRLRGTRPLTFKTTFGAVTVRRSRIEHKKDGTMEVPSARAWNTSHQLHLTRNLRDAVCDQMSEHSAGASRAEIGEHAGEPDLLGRSTVIEIVHDQGGRLIPAQRERARATLAEASQGELEALGPCLVADPDSVSAHEPDDDPPWDPEDPQWQPEAPAVWVVTGFPGGEPSPPVSPDEPRAVDDDVVIVEPDEVKTKAQPATGRKEIWTYTAVVLVAGLRYALADATTEGLWLQVSGVRPVNHIFQADRGRGMMIGAPS